MTGSMTRERASRRLSPTAVVIAAGSLITAISLGSRSTMGVFIDPISDDLVIGTGAISLAIAIQNIVWGISQPIAGGIADRWGSGRVLAAGSVLYAGGLVLMARATTSNQLYLSAGLVVGVGLAAASFSVVLAAIGRRVPPERRSFALGVATAFGSVGQFVLVPTIGLLIRRMGWTDAMLVLAGVTMAILIGVRSLRTQAQPATTATSNATGPDEETLRQALRRAMRHRSYLLLNLGFLVCGFHVTFIGVHLPKYVGDLGQSAALGDVTLSLIGFFNIAGAVAAGVLGQRRSPTQLLSFIYAGRALAILALLLLPNSPATLVIFSAAMGVFWLSTVPLTSSVVMSQFGLKHAGSLFGVVFLSHQIGAFIGVYGGGALRDATGSYELWWWISVILAVFAAILHYFIDEGPADQKSALAPTRPRVGFRRPRLAPTVATASAFGALAAFAVLTSDASAEAVEARQHSVVCFLYDPGSDQIE